jgi:hypothetical protein
VKMPATSDSPSGRTVYLFSGGASQSVAAWTLASVGRNKLSRSTREPSTDTGRPTRIDLHLPSAPPGKVSAELTVLK